MTYIVVTGNPFSGLTLYGPFASFDAADEWAQTNCNDTEWTIVEVCNPN